MPRSFGIAALALVTLSCGESTAPTATSLAVQVGPSSILPTVLEPTSGTPAGGTTVVVNGTFALDYISGWFCFFGSCFPRFSSALHQVWFGSAPAAVVGRAYDRLTVVSPPGSIGVVPVRVRQCTTYCSEWIAEYYTYVNPNRPPVANAGGPYSLSEGDALTLNGAASSDPDSQALTFDWSFGDGATALNAGPSPSHTFADNGVYVSSLTVTDPYGVTNTASAVVTVANVAPSVSTLPSATIVRGEFYSTAGTFTDPGADTHAALVAWGDNATEPVSLLAGAFAVAHQYAAAGTFTVTVTITDDDEGSGVSTATVTVLSPEGASGALSTTLDDLVANGDVPESVGTSLAAPIDAATASLARGNTTAAFGQLGAFVNRLDAAVKSGRVSPAVAASLKSYVNRIRASMGG